MYDSLLEVLMLIQLIRLQLEVILDLMIVMLSAIGCDFEVIDQIGKLALLEDILIAHGNIVVVLISERLDIVEDDSSDIYVF